jgi:hypothetical protein
VSALQIVGALGAVLGSGIVFYLVVQIDALTSPMSADSVPTARARNSGPSLEQKAA